MSVSPVYDVLILGAGFAGLATAYYLPAHLKIAILEKEKNVAQQASGKNAALFRHAVSIPGVAPLIRRSWEQLQNPPGDWKHSRVLDPTASYLLGNAAQLDPHFQLLRSMNIPAKLFDFGSFPASIPPTLETWLQKAHYEKLLYCPDDGVVNLLALRENLEGALRARKVEIHLETEALEIKKSQDCWNIISSRGNFKASWIVNASGAWASAMGNQVGSAQPTITPYRRHLYVSENLPEVQSAWPYIWDLSQDYYFRPESQGLLLCPGDEEAQEAGTPEVDPRWELELHRKFQKYFPNLENVRIDRAWACLRAKNASREFVIGMDSQIPNFFWVAGLGGHGVSACLGVGQKAAEELVEIFKQK